MKIIEDDDFERRRAAWIAETQRQLRLLEGRYVVTDQPTQPTPESIARDRWNREADQFNQWSELGEDEKAPLIERARNQREETDGR